ncbi:hypothetical protein [Kitasatospora phosalacinea]|uniref:hypothetical protein n=1 Tax=Kitasatospora phosalacinea TaxID=2065 RepID=UPI00052464B0|nr:hypothetical protein [Kitasatospora phosalacinea]
MTVTLKAADRKPELASEARRAVLRMDRTERPRLVVVGTGEVSPYLEYFFGPAIPLVTNVYYLAVTDRSVFVLRGSRTTGEVRRAVAVVPLEQAGRLVAKVRHGRTWNTLWLRLPQHRGRLRVNVSFQSRPELDRFLARLPDADRT